MFIQNIDMTSMEEFYMHHSVAITGHRPHKLPWGQDEESPLCGMLKAALLIRILMLIDKGYNTFYTGMNWGVDLIFGELVINLKEQYPDIKLIGVLPYEDMHVKWHTSYQERHFDLVEECDNLIVLSQAYNNDCFKELRKYLVDNSKRVIAVFDDRYLSSGTLQTIKVAKFRGRTITYINPSTLKPRTIKGRPELRLIR